MECFSCVVYVVVVVCLPRLREGMGRLQFSDLFTELTVPPQAARVVGTFKCVFIIYNSDHYGLICGVYSCAE